MTMHSPRRDTAGLAVNDDHRLSSPPASDPRVWEWFQAASAKFAQVRAANRQLASRITELEFRLAHRLTDDELLAELPGRTARVLQSAREVADEILAEARTRASLVEKQACEHADRLTASAERHSVRVVGEANTRAEERVESAERSREKIAAAARAERDVIVADLVARRAALDNEIQHGKARLDELKEAYGAIRNILRDVAGRIEGEIHPRTSPITDQVDPQASPGDRPARRFFPREYKHRERVTAGSLADQEASLDAQG